MQAFADPYYKVPPYCIFVGEMQAFADPYYKVLPYCIIGGQ